MTLESLRETRPTTASGTGRQASPVPGRILSVGGGKGGVGKSLLAANLGVSIAQLGSRVVLIDCDLGSANQHSLFGIRRSVPTLQDFFDHQVEKLSDLKIATEVPGLALIPGVGNVPGAANINHAQKLRLLRHIESLEADVVIVDVGGGVSFNTIDLFNAADLRLLVLTPQLTSLQNGYGFLKSAVYRVLNQVAVRAGEPDQMERLGKLRESERLPQALDALSLERPAIADEMRLELARFGARLIGNQSFGASDQSTFHAISRMVQDFLGLRFPVVGTLRASRALHDSVNAGKPFALEPAGSENQRVFRDVAKFLMNDLVVRSIPDAPKSLDLPAPSEPEPLAEAEPTDGLPSALERYERIKRRFPVRWGGTLRGPFDGNLYIQLRDISESGAGISTNDALEVGQHWTLAVDTPAGRFSVPTVVRHVSVAGRAGLEFLGTVEGIQAVLKAAQAAVSQDTSESAATG